MKVINGSQVKLTKINIKDYKVFHLWFSDKEAVKYSLGRWQKKHSPIQIKHWLEKTLKDKSVVNFAIRENSTNSLIGYAGICSISKSSNSGEYFIFIGEKEAWGKGYGTEVTKLVTNFGFTSLKLHRVFLTVSEPNLGAVKAYTKAGYKKEGILRDATLRDNKYHDNFVMSILDSEWKLN